MPVLSLHCLIQYAFLYLIVSPLDNIIREKFCAKLKDKEVGSGLVSHAAVAGGYLHILFSTEDIGE
jgi:hypothetical protein